MRHKLGISRGLEEEGEEGVRIAAAQVCVAAQGCAGRVRGGGGCSGS